MQRTPKSLLIFKTINLSFCKKDAALLFSPVHFSIYWDEYLLEKALLPPGFPAILTDKTFFHYKNEIIRRRLKLNALDVSPPPLTPTDVNAGGAWPSWP